MDRNEIDEIDLTLHAIQQMVEVSLRATEGLHGTEDDPAVFQMRSADANLLDFSLFDIQKRVRALRAELQPKESATAPVLTLVR